MPYTVTPTNLSEVLILEPQVFDDNRGFFFESFSQYHFHQATGLDSIFVQDNHSKSSKGVIRGLHYQIKNPQGKLVRVTLGTVFDVAVDLRRSSPNFGKWVGTELSAENKRQLWIPQALLMVSWLLVTPLSFYTKQPTIGIPRMSERCCGVTQSLVLIGLWILITVYQQKMLLEKP